VICSVNCFCQNKNMSIVAFCLQLIHKECVKTVKHKYIASGHSYIPCDRDFGLIEKDKRSLKYVYTCHAYEDLRETIHC